MSETPRTAEQLSSNLKSRAYDCGQDETIDNPSQARLDRHEAALRKAEKDVIERIATLERELAAMTSAKELAERQVAVLCKRLCVHVDCVRCPAKTEGCLTKCDITTAAWSRAEAEGGKG
jgi:hypothetical protein